MNTGLSFELRDHLPYSVTRLVVFEDSYRFYDQFPTRTAHTLIPISWLPWIDPSRGLGAVFASKSLGLQHLAISFMISAEELFRRCQSAWCWPHLQSLALTSRLLQDGADRRDQIEALLCRASVLVQQMPKLHTFVLWNGGKAHACAFIYRIDRGRASVTWRGSWHLEFRPLVVGSWQLAASKLPSPKLELKEERIQGAINSHGDAIYHLELPCKVIEPASLWQIRREL